MSGLQSSLHSFLNHGWLHNHTLSCFFAILVMNAIKVMLKYEHVLLNYHTSDLLEKLAVTDNDYFTSLINQCITGITRSSKLYDLLRKISYYDRNLTANPVIKKGNALAT